MDNTLIVTWAMTVLSTILTGVILWKHRSQSEKNEKFSTSITSLENTAVNDEHVRRVIREEMQQLNTMLPKVLEALREIQTELAEQRGYQAGQIAAQRRAADPQ